MPDGAIHYKLYLLKLTMAVDNFVFRIIKTSILMFISISYVCVFVYSRTPLIRPPSESHWCGRIRGMVAREGFVYKQNAQSVTRNVVV